MLLNKFAKSVICAVRASHDKALTACFGLHFKAGRSSSCENWHAGNQQVVAVTRRWGSTAWIAKTRGMSAGFLCTAISLMPQSASARF